MGNQRHQLVNHEQILSSGRRPLFPGGLHLYNPEGFGIDRSEVLHPHHANHRRSPLLVDDQDIIQARVERIVVPCRHAHPLAHSRSVPNIAYATLVMVLISGLLSLKYSEVKPEKAFGPLLKKPKPKH